MALWSHVSKDWPWGLAAWQWLIAAPHISSVPSMSYCKVVVKNRTQVTCLQYGLQEVTGVKVSLNLK